MLPFSILHLSGAFHWPYPNLTNIVSVPTGLEQGSSNFGLCQKLLEDLLKLTAPLTPRFCSGGLGRWSLGAVFVVVAVIYFLLLFCWFGCGTGDQTVVFVHALHPQPKNVFLTSLYRDLSCWLGHTANSPCRASTGGFEKYTTLLSLELFNGAGLGSASF